MLPSPEHRDFWDAPCRSACGADGHSVTAVSLRTQPAPEMFEGCHAVVNLAGEPVAQRWTAAAREAHFEQPRSKVRGLLSPRFGSIRLRCW